MRYQPKFWKLMALRGEVELYGQYKEVYYLTGMTENRESNELYSGRIDLNTRSYFWHPNFMTLDLSAGYNPGAGEDVSILMPDYSIQNSAKYFASRLSLLNKHKIRLEGFANYRDTYGNLENLSKTNTKDLKWGGRFNSYNRLLPFTITYTNYENEQYEEYQDRLYLNSGEEILGVAKRSFGSLDEHEMTFSLENFSRELVGVYLTQNDVKDFSLRNRIYFDKEKRFLFTSNILYYDQIGTDSYGRYWIMENLNFQLPANLQFFGSYKFSGGSQGEIENSNNTIDAMLRHRLYESLVSSVYFKNTENDHTNADQYFNRYGFNLDYTKTLPLKGRIFLSYNYFLQDEIGGSGASDINIVKEPQTLTDGVISLLRLPKIYRETIIVRDEPGSLIFQEDIDYILIERNEFIEIQRVPGGLISNGATVFVDYVAQSTGDYKFKMHSNFFMSRLSFFDNKLETFYKYRKQDYKDVQTDSELNLQFVDQQNYGLRFQYRFISAGVERDKFDSNVVPYDLTRYFLDLRASVKSKLNLSLNGSFTDYHLIGEEGRTQQFLNISGGLNYRLTPTTRLDLRAGYRKQEGEGVDLDLFIAGAEITTRFRRTMIKLTGDLYRKNYLITEKNHFNAINLRIIRNF